MTDPIFNNDGAIVVPANAHRLQLEKVDLLGAGRRVRFRPGFNIIQGHVSTGKTTMVRLIRALLGTVPDELPPEVDHVTAIRADVVIGNRLWGIYRPRTSTSSAPVDVTEQDLAPGREPLSLRLPATGAQNSYSTFMLGAVGLPIVSVPDSRSKPTGNQTPISMTDWLGYCIVTGDELDTQVFGHQHTFRNIKRRWVFELIYGYYDAELAQLTSRLRGVQLALAAHDREAIIREKFFQGTPLASATALEQQLQTANTKLGAVDRTVGEDVQVVDDIPEVQRLRRELLDRHAHQAEILARIDRVQGQVKDLQDLHTQLTSQSARMTRAIVADEWLVDFDFIVCPRCGNDVEPSRAPDHHCYLCLQPSRPATSRNDLLAEQDRMMGQIRETAEVLGNRKKDLNRLRSEADRSAVEMATLTTELDLKTRSFVSSRAARLQDAAAQQATALAEVSRLKEYLGILSKLDEIAAEREDLERQQDDIQAAISAKELRHSGAEENVRALETRMLEYLEALRPPPLAQALTVTINRKTYIPEVWGRSFDELSSQGLKTVVNIAHALAHHTVAIDRALPLPGLLVLDGLSANVGTEGFDQALANNIYRLLRRVGTEYADRLQLIGVDNSLPESMVIELASYSVLSLREGDRLIKIPEQP